MSASHLNQFDRDTIGEVEVFLRMMARMPADEFSRRKAEISEACSAFADFLDRMHAGEEVSEDDFPPDTFD